MTDLCYLVFFHRTKNVEAESLSNAYYSTPTAQFTHCFVKNDNVINRIKEKEIRVRCGRCSIHWNYSHKTDDNENNLTGASPVNWIFRSLISSVD